MEKQVYKSLVALHESLEKNVNSHKKDWQISSSIQASLENISNPIERKSMKWESCVFDLEFRNGELKSLNSSVREDGSSIYQYPSYNDFKEDGFTFLIKRINTTSNLYLKSRYAHILWLAPAPYKHKKYASIAADAYLQILEELRPRQKKKDHSWHCMEILKNTASICFAAKYRVEDVKRILRKWLFQPNLFPAETKIFLVQFMLESDHFSNVEFGGIEELIVKLGKLRSRKVTDYFFTKEIYQTGLKVAQRLRSDTKIWNRRIADAIIRMAVHRMDDETKMIPLGLLKEAIPYYKLAGEKKKVTETEQKYFELKKQLKLSKIEVPLDEEAAEAMTQYLNNKAESILQTDTNNILGHLLMGTDIFPPHRWLEDIEKNTNNSFMDFAVKMRFDINNNVSKEKDDPSIKAKAKLFQNYGLYMRVSVLPLLHRIFVDGIRRNMLDFNSTIVFLHEHTWYGQKLSGYDSTGDLVEYTWLPLLAPAIHEYFLQTTSALRSYKPYTNYVMPVDSLTLKFEGALRDFVSLLNVSTTVSGKGNVLREKYIEELLQEEKVRRYFNQDDLLLFEYLFVSKEGLNLRNNIAHSFYRFTDYNFQQMHLLICAFLRLGKYRISIKQ